MKIRGTVVVEVDQEELERECRAWVCRMTGECYIRVEDQKVVKIEYSPSISEPFDGDVLGDVNDPELSLKVAAIRFLMELERERFSRVGRKKK